MKRQRNTDADILSRRLDRAAEVIPVVLRHIDEQLHQARISASRPEGPQSRGSHSDPTGARVVAVANIDTKRTDIFDALASIRLGVKLLEESCARALGTIVRPTEGEPICHQAGCSELVSSYTRDDGSIGYRLGGQFGGLCDSHRAKAYRERDKAA